MVLVIIIVIVIVLNEPLLRGVGVQKRLGDTDLDQSFSPQLLPTSMAKLKYCCRCRWLTVFLMVLCCMVRTALLHNALFPR